MISAVQSTDAVSCLLAELSKGLQSVREQGGLTLEEAFADLDSDEPEET